jgi:peroxiredoxin
MRKGLTKLIPPLNLPVVAYDHYDDAYKIRYNQDTQRLFSRRNALIGIPGAFFPSAQYRLLPEYLNLKHEIKALGKLNQIFVLSVNDPNVLQVFAEEIDAEEHFVYIADFAGQMAHMLSTLMDFEELGPRSKAFSSVVEDSSVTLLEIEEDWRISKTSRVHHFLSRLSPYIPYPGGSYDN